VLGLRVILRSHRWRRRFAWLGGFAALLGGVVLAAFLLPGVHGNQELVPTGTPPPQTVTVTKSVRVTAAERRAVERTLSAFVKTAVTRDDPAAAWDLVTEEMKGGVSRKEWNAGQLPVIPFPAKVPKRLSWNVLSSLAGDLTVDLLLQPRPATNRGAIAFAVELQQEKGSGRWLVASMVPEHVFSPAPTTPVGRTPKPVAVPKSQVMNGALSRWWLVAPGVLLAMIVLIPVGVLLNTWHRNRTIERRYRAERGL
jgi:hypothetical protein